MTPTRLEVWGDPIDHSRSPHLHTAAYAVLGLDWQYGRRRVSAAGFSSELAGLDAQWRGLSLTMPLKEEAHRAAASLDRHAELTGAVNTLLPGSAPVGFNTDVGGIVDAVGGAGTTALEAARVLGSGATAASAVVALAEMGAQRIDVRARRPERAAELVALGDRLGIRVEVQRFAAAADAVDVTVATLPSGTVLDTDVVDPLAASGGLLLDAAYAPWPSALAAGWTGGAVVSGLEMLLHQAVRQIRIFRHGEPSEPLPDEAAVLAAMRATID